MSALDALLEELEDVLVRAADMAANARDYQDPGPLRHSLHERMVVPIGVALDAARNLQTEPPAEL